MHDAQAQGYRGKRFSLSYQPAYSFYEAYDVSVNPIGHHKFDFGMAFKNITLNVTWQHSFMSQNNHFELEEGYIEGESQVPTNLGDLHVKDIVWGGQINFYKKEKRAFAPFGKYIGFGIEKGFGNSMTADTFYVYVADFRGDIDTSTHYISAYDDRERVPITLLSFYIGRNFVFKESFLFGYGIQFSAARPSEFRRPGYFHMAKPFFNFGFIF